MAGKGKNSCLPSTLLLQNGCPVPPGSFGPYNMFTMGGEGEWRREGMVEKEDGWWQNREDGSVVERPHSFSHEAVTLSQDDITSLETLVLAEMRRSNTGVKRDEGRSVTREAVDRGDEGREGVEEKGADEEDTIRAMHPKDRLAGTTVLERKVQVYETLFGSEFDENHESFFALLHEPASGPSPLLSRSQAHDHGADTGDRLTTSTRNGIFEPEYQYLGENEKPRECVGEVVLVQNIPPPRIPRTPDTSLSRTGAVDEPRRVVKVSEDGSRGRSQETELVSVTCGRVRHHPASLVSFALPFDSLFPSLSLSFPLFISLSLTFSLFQFTPFHTLLTVISLFLPPFLLS